MASENNLRNAPAPAGFESAQGYARGSGQVGRISVRPDTAAADGAAAVPAAAPVYARDAVDASGRRIRDLQGRIDDAKAQCAAYIAQQPVRASLIAVASGLVLTALLLSLLRGKRH